jgi:cell division protein FtsB
MLERLRSLLPSTALALLIAYFIFHALTGERGWLTAGRRDAELAERRNELVKLHAQRVDLEARVRLLRSGSLSADMVEERARAVLGFVDPKDYVIREAP